MTKQGRGILIFASVSGGALAALLVAEYRPPTNSGEWAAWAAVLAAGSAAFLNYRVLMRIAQEEHRRADREQSAKTLAAEGALFEGLLAVSKLRNLATLGAASNSVAITPARTTIRNARENFALTLRSGTNEGGLLSLARRGDQCMSRIETIIDDTERRDGRTWVGPNEILENETEELRYLEGERAKLGEKLGGAFTGAPVTLTGRGHA